MSSPALLAQPKGRGSLALFSTIGMIKGLMSSILPWIQIVLSVILIISIILQQTGAGLGGAFGGDEMGAGFHTRRGIEKFLFYTTIVVAVLFAISAFVALFI